VGTVCRDSISGGRAGTRRAGLLLNRDNPRHADDRPVVPVAAVTVRPNHPLDVPIAGAPGQPLPAVHDA
jgi:hypothetical protein